MNNRSQHARTLLSFALLLGLFIGIPAQTALAQAEQDVPSEQEIATHYSLYYEDFKNANYQSALPNLKWILENAPGFPRDDDRNFRRAIDAYESLAENDPSYLDSALVVFEEAVPRLEEAGIDADEQTWLINKGRFIQTHSAHFPNSQELISEAYMQAYELAPENIGAYYINYLVSDINSRGDREATLGFMERVEETHGDDAEVVDYIARVRDSLFRTPEERIAFLETQLERNPEDVDVISELFDLYLRTGARAQATQLSERLLQAQPTARTYELIARMRLEDGETSEAIQLYERALEMAESNERRRDIYYNMGVAQQQEGRLSSARTQFRRALEIDPSFGNALMAIGDLYVTQVANCGSFERDDRAVYWLAVDYYERAAQADPSIASQARQKARSYTSSFPTAEDIFYKGWEVGSRININYGCYSWIGESTTVRRP